MTGVPPQAGSGHSGSTPSPDGLGHSASVPNAALLELAERCEQATGPDRRLDVEIAVAADWRWPDWEEGESTARSQAEKHGVDWLVGRTTHGMASMWRHIPRYTASLDAAMTLVPEGAIVAVTNCDPNRGAVPDFSRAAAIVGNPDDTEEPSVAATPALALCAAALRARAAQ